jgi:hypothetical protein
VSRKYDEEDNEDNSSLWTKSLCISAQGRNVSQCHLIFKLRMSHHVIELDLQRKF